VWSKRLQTDEGWRLPFRIATPMYQIRLSLHHTLWTRVLILDWSWLFVSSWFRDFCGFYGFIERFISLFPGCL